MIGGICQARPDAGFVSGVLDYVDCQAQAIGAGGFQSLAAPGSPLSLVLSGLLTLFVALFGYRMLLGDTPGVRDGVLSVVKIGIVLALAFSWPAYRTLIYDVALKGPAELAAAVGRPAGLPGSGGGLVARLDNADNAFVTLGLLGTGAGPPMRTADPQAGASASPAPSTFDPLALGGARIVFLTGALGALAGMRLIAGLMLALGPFFIAFLLFDGTRGLFEGWIRVLAGSALGALGTSVVLGVELALIEPWLVELIASRNAGYSIPGAPVELLVVNLVFSLAILAVLIAAWRLTVGFGLPAAWRAAPARLIEAMRTQDQRLTSDMRREAASADADRSRAVVVANALAATQRREALIGGTGYEAAARRAEPHGSDRTEVAGTPYSPLGQSSRRRSHGRISASAGRRDKVR